MNRNRIAFIICLALGILGINLYFSVPRENPAMEITRSDNSVQLPKSLKPRTTATIKVQISGAINNPGIYELEKGSRVEELVLLAGGLTAEANKDKANLAKLLKDGMLVNIPASKNIRPISAANTKASGGQLNSNYININTADQQTLQSLKGIGPVLAKRIVDWRQANGRFTSKQELLKVQGIGPKLFSSLEAQLALE